nr:hypothetical protein [Mycoplasmopsis bovis]
MSALSHDNKFISKPTLKNYWWGDGGALKARGWKKCDCWSKEKKFDEKAIS